MVITAGYGDKLETIFQGNIDEMMSDKKGTDWITTIKAKDGIHAIQNGYTSLTVASGTKKEDLIKNVIADMPNLIAGVLGSPAESEKSSKRSEVLVGNSAGIITAQTDGKAFIDNEEMHILSRDEVLTSPQVLLIGEENPLLSTPKRRETFIDVPVLFYPQARAGELCELRSIVKLYNGGYKIIGFIHDITISQSLSGNATTMLQLDAGSGALIYKDRK